MSSYNSFIEKNKIRMAAADDVNSMFIHKGYPSTIITCGETSLAATVVNRQEQEKAYVYTELDNPLDIGSVWSTKGLHLLIVEEIIIIKDVMWRKYIALLCNTIIDDMWCYFKGSEKAAISTSIKENVFLNTQAKPVLVAPSGRLNFNDKIIINNRAWKVIEWDDVSTAGITYYTLEPSTVAKKSLNEEKPVNIVKHNIEDTTISYMSTTQEGNVVHVKHNRDIEVITNGVFKSSVENLKIKKRTKDSIIFSIPFGVDQVDITTLQGDVLVTTTYITI